MPQGPKAPPTTEHRLYFSGGINAESAGTFANAIINIQGRDDCTSLTILFASDGGLTNPALSIYNLILSAPKPVHMHAVGNVGSAATTIFLAGHRRTATPLSRFFFHEHDYTFNQPVTLHRIDEAVQLLKSDVQFAREVLRTRTNVPKTVPASLDGSGPPVILDAAQGKEFGIVEKVFELTEPESPGANVMVWHL